MSIKGQLLHAVLPQPQVTSNFAILIPGLISSPIRCHAASMPSDSRNAHPINVSGESIWVPGKSQPESSGTWTCSVYESVLMDMSINIEALKAMEVTETRGIPMSTNMHDIYIMLFNNHGVPTFGKVLRHAFLKSVSAVQLSADDATKIIDYTLTFQYSFCDRLI